MNGANFLDGRFTFVRNGTDPMKPIDQKLQTAYGHGSGLALSPQEVIVLYQERMALQKLKLFDAGSLSSSPAIGFADAGRNR